MQVLCDALFPGTAAISRGHDQTGRQEFVAQTSQQGCAGHTDFARERAAELTRTSPLGCSETVEERVGKCSGLQLI